MEKSIQNYKRAIEINNQDWDARRGLGVAYILSSKKDDGSIDEELKQKAVEQWNWSLEINPNQPNNERLRKLLSRYSE